MEADLALCGVQYAFLSSNPKDLIVELAKLLKQKDRGTFVNNLMYRVDVDPNKIQSDGDYYMDLSLILWDRVFKKVWIRKHYSSN